MFKKGSRRLFPFRIRNRKMENSGKQKVRQNSMNDINLQQNETKNFPSNLMSSSEYLKHPERSSTLNLLLYFLPYIVVLSHSVNHSTISCNGLPSSLQGENGTTALSLHKLLPPEPECYNLFCETLQLNIVFSLCQRSPFRHRKLQ